MPSGGIADEEDGIAYIEYLVLTASLTLAVGAAFLALGPLLVRFYHHVQLTWSAPFP